MYNMIRVVESMRSKGPRVHPIIIYHFVLQWWILTTPMHYIVARTIVDVSVFVLIPRKLA